MGSLAKQFAHVSGVQDIVARYVVEYMIQDIIWQTEERIHYGTIEIIEVMDIGNNHAIVCIPVDKVALTINLMRAKVEEGIA